RARPVLLCRPPFRNRSLHPVCHSRLDDVSLLTLCPADVLRTAFALLTDSLRLVRLMLQCRAQLAAENLFLRKQLACYVEHQARPHRTDWWSGYPTTTVNDDIPHWVLGSRT